MNISVCDLAYNVSYNPLYRISQVYTATVSILALFPIGYLTFICLPRTNFNPNVKFLYSIYFLQIFISVLDNCCVFTHHVITPFFAHTKCDLIVDTTKLAIFSYIGIFGISCPMLTILGITGERLLALILAKSYENLKLRVGLIVGGFAVVCDIIIIITLFGEEKFDKPQMSYFMMPATSGSAMNLLSWTLLVVNGVNLICNYILFKLNTKLSKFWRNSLSTRYQMEENILTTHFSTYITFLHFFFFMLYLVFSLLIRTLGMHFFTSEAELLSIRGVYITIPTYNLLIGVVSCRILGRLQRKKSARIEAEVAMKYGGSEGARAHDEAILSVWNSKVG